MIRAEIPPGSVPRPGLPNARLTRRMEIDATCDPGTAERASEKLRKESMTDELLAALVTGFVIGSILTTVGFIWAIKGRNE